MDNRKIGLVVMFLMVISSITVANNPQKSTSSDKVVYESREFHKLFENCGNPISKCPTVDMCYPEVVSTPNAVAKDSINKYVKDVLINGPPQGVVYDAQRGQRLNSFDQVASELFSDYSDYMEMGGAGVYLFHDYISVASETCGILSLQFDHLEYTGGAHENYWRCFLNFDIYSGKQVHLSDVLKRGFESKLSSMAKLRFKEVRGENSRLWEVYQKGDFPLANNYSIGREGITFYYNPFDVGDFAEGTTELSIKYDEIKDLIDEKGLLKRKVR